MGQRQAARETLEALLQMAPDHVGAQFQLGEMDLEEQKPKEALQRFEAGLINHDDMPSLNFGVGVAAFQLGDLERAAAALSRCVEAAPDYLQAHYYLALVAEARGQRDRAVEEYRTEVENHPDHYESWFNLSLLLAEAGDFDGASDALRRTIAAKPDLAAAHVLLGQALLARGDPQGLDEAIEAVERGLALNLPRDMHRLGREILETIRKLRRSRP
jgi:tetratricopeptide (TPR) repeat protein